jgi:predicted DNA-binding protein
MAIVLVVPYTHTVTQVIVELDASLAERLERVAPARSRQRSAFIREAIRRALDEAREQEMALAYQRQPQEPVEVDLDPETWDASGFVAPRRRARRNTR